MIADHEANVVYVADSLERKFPDVHVGLRTILERHGIPLRVIPGTKDIWCRDYMPVQVADDRFVQFRYAPDYLTGKYRHLRADGEIGPTLPFLRNCERSEIVMDGGNVVRWGKAAIVTDKIYKENPGLGRVKLRDRLGRALRVETLIVIRRESYDTIGHVDGMVRWLDDRAVVVNDYRAVGASYRNSILRTIRQFGIEPIEIPYHPQESHPREIPSAFGNWANFLRVGKLIVVPTFGAEVDHVVLGMLRECRLDLVVEGLDCSDLAREGGLLNCVTWQIEPIT